MKLLLSRLLLGVLLFGVGAPLWSQAPVISPRPLSRRVALGSSPTFAAPASGAGEITYVWKRNGQILPGASGATLTLPSVSRADRGTYQVLATNAVGTTLSVFLVEVDPAQAARTSALWPATSTYTPFAGQGNLVAIDQGESYLLGLKDDGTLIATAETTTMPAGLGEIVAISASRYVRLALGADGVPHAWGIFYATIPAGLGPVVGIASGERHSVFLQSDGTVVDTMPGAPADLKDVIAVSAGLAFGLALKADGTVVGWNNSTIPVPAGLSGVTAIVAGDDHALALKADGTVVAWGGNAYGQATVPAGLRDVQAIDADEYLSAALTSGGTVVLWGNNAGTTVRPPDWLTGAVAVTAGRTSAAALFTPQLPVITASPTSRVLNAGDDLTLSVAFSGHPAVSVQWMRNGVAVASAASIPLGQTSASLVLPEITTAQAGGYQAILSNAAGTVASATAVITVLNPPRVLRRPGAARVRAGQTFGVTVNAEGLAPLTYVWTRQGQVVPGATTASFSIAAVGPADRGWYAVEITDAAGLSTTVRFPLVVVPAVTRLIAWTVNPTNETAVPAGLTDVTSAVLGDGHGLALRANGTVLAWGDNQFGESTVPAGIGPAIAIAAGQAHSLAVLADGSVAAWGKNLNGETAVPAGLGGVGAVAAGASFSLALKTDGTLVGWGKRGSGGAFDLPANLGAVRAVTARGNTCFALLENGRVMQLAPTIAALDLRDVVDLAAGDTHGVFLLGSGAVVTRETQAMYDPRWLTIPASLSEVLLVGAGRQVTFAVPAAGAVYAAGTSFTTTSPEVSNLGEVVAITGGYDAGLAIQIPQPPSITQPPTARTVATGADATFTVGVSGTGPFQYEWQRNGSKLVDGSAVFGATTSLLGIRSVAANDAGLYSVKVTGPEGSVTSAGVHLVVLPPPALTAGVVPVRQAVAGQEVVLAVSAGSSPGATYQWRRDGNPLAGATGGTHVIASASRGDAGVYDALVTRAGATTAEGATLLQVAPVQPPGKLVIDRTVHVGAEILEGWIYTLATAPDGKLYAGGDFSSIDGRLRTRVARFNADGTLDPSFVPLLLNGTVFAVLPLADGKVWIGGSFVDLPGATRTYSRLARLNADGSLDESWAPITPNGDVMALALQSGGGVLVGGAFSGTVDGGPAYLLRLSANGTRDLTFNAAITTMTGGGLWSIAVDSADRIVIGGVFTRLAGYTRVCVARLTPGGGVDAVFAPTPGTNNAVYQVALEPDGAVVVVGGFTTFNGYTCGRVARVRPDGSLDQPFLAGGGTGLDASAYAVLRQPDGRFVIGGLFSKYGVATSNGVVRLNNDGSRDPTFAVGPNNTVAALALMSDGRIQLGGYFSKIGTDFRFRLARVRSDGGLEPGLNVVPLSPGRVNVLQPVPGGKTIVAGYFHALAGRFGPSHLARLNPDLTYDTTFNPGGLGPNGEVTRLAPVGDGRMWIGGTFTSYNGTPRARLARVQAEGLIDGAFDPRGGPATAPTALLGLPNGALALASDSYDGVTTGFARIASDGTRDTTVPVGLFNAAVSQLSATSDGRLIAAGAFNSAGVNSARGAARLTEFGVIEARFGGASDGLLTAKPLPDGSIVMGSETILLRADATLAQMLEYNAPSVHRTHELIAQEDGRVLVRGTIGSYEGAPDTVRLARLRANGLRDDSFELRGIVGEPRTLAVLDSGRLLIAGADTPGLGLAVPAGPIISVQPTAQTVVEGGSVVLGVSASGPGPLAYQWMRDGVALPGATTATLVLPAARVDNAGVYSVLVRNAVETVASGPARLVVNAILRGLVSAHAQADTGAGALRGAFTIEGSGPKTMLIRAVGPTLAGLGVSGAAADPNLSVVRTVSETEVAANDNWGGAPNAAAIASAALAVGAHPLPAGSADAAVLATLEPGTYRVNVGTTGGAGVVSLQIYDASDTPRLVYVATRATAGGSSGLAQAVGVLSAPAGRTYLVRALGPATGLAGALADPQLSIHSGNTQLAANDDWNGDPAVVAAAHAVGAMPISALGRDAALLFTPASAGVYSLQVSGAGGARGVVLVEIYEVDALRSATVPLALITAPGDASVTAGDPALFGVVAVGKPTPTYQWRKDGVTLVGAVSSLLAIPRAQVADAGTYVVRVTNGGTAAFEAAATLAVTAANQAQQALVEPFYPAGGTLGVSNTLHFAGAPASLAWSVELPAGWSFASDTAVTAAVRPAANATGTLRWVWSAPAASPVAFSYRVNVPPGESGTRALTATFTVGAGSPLAVWPTPLAVDPPPALHSADTDRNGRLSLLELTRVIELYNTRLGTTRTGAYAVAPAASEDGFVAETGRPGGAVVALARHHSADANRDGKLSLLELTRVIELYNTRSGTTRTGQYHAQAGTEDGFAAGP